MAETAVPEIAALFWDIGGVILTNGWDTDSRDEAARRFGLDRADFERRHEGAFPDFEVGRITLDAYLDRAIFFQPRPFTLDDFKAFMFSRSSENAPARAVLDEVTAAGGCLLAALNNEGREINAYRIERFHLERNFTVFLSSCYLGLRKPEESIYRRALEITHRAPEESVFIDDRLPNVEGARRVGMNVIHFQNAAQLRGELARCGVQFASAQGEVRRWNSA
jgi:putative hydrolase of the HAD superfamily